MHCFLIFQFGGVQGFKIFLSFFEFPRCLLLCFPNFISNFVHFYIFSLTFIHFSKGFLKSYYFKIQFVSFITHIIFLLFLFQLFFTTY